MNITPHVNPLPVATVVNPPTDNLRHENTQRPIITAPTQTSGSPAEKGTADKQKAADQPNEQLNFTELQKSAEKNANQIIENSEQNPHNQDQDSQQNDEQQASAEDNQEHIEAEIDEKNAAIIRELKARDQEVRTHEQAHASVGGVHTGSPSYEFEVGPDGKKYAVAGEVSADLSPVEGDPQATITKMEQVYAAALAPAEPSAQDMKVAAQANQLKVQAQAELSALTLDESEGSRESNKASPYVGSSGVFRAENNLESDSFDQQINQTLAAQERIAPTRSNDVKERSERIEGYYSNILNAHQKPPSHQFELTV
jgi:hypothetical protein